MTDLESLVRDTLADEARRAPDGGDLAARVDERLRTDRPGLRAAALAAAAGVVLATVIGGATLLAARGASDLEPGGSSPTPAVTDTSEGAAATATAAVADLPLVSEGPCAGLRVRLVEPDPSPEQVRTLRPLVPGPGNRWTTDGNQLLYLQATGPCTQRLGFDVVEPEGQDRVQGPSGDLGQRFRDGLGALITHAETPGTARVEIVLGCLRNASCVDTGTVVASLTLTVTEPDVPLTTQQPSSAPAPRVTVTFTQNGRLTSSVTPVPPGGGAETVTETLAP